ncbi:hypothetical protein OMAG_000911 [Candidatus Omnitrophus magneticus]|uniref:Uncharacterized protein n=1 Tax=Candidatus Omnitrophus magneticus TaxID=1609969 RepID=A0A0F0CT60_9BACT|nr:hypothetical protein OMAG_000911 [Candidatus Omnitrophus magneticus]
MIFLIPKILGFRDNSNMSRVMLSPIYSAWRIFLNELIPRMIFPKGS